MWLLGLSGCATRKAKAKDIINDALGGSWII